MATTTATVELTSDLLSDNISVISSSILMKAGTTADGLDMVDYMQVTGCLFLGQQKMLTQT